MEVAKTLYLLISPYLVTVDEERTVADIKGILESAASEIESQIGKRSRMV